MSIGFVCPHCGTASQVDSRYAGTSGPCRVCGQTITIPAPAAGTPFGPATAPRARSKATIVLLIMACFGLLCICSGIPAALLLPAVQSARNAGRNAVCQNNLKQIGIALHNYNSEFGCFPPAYLADAQGQPMHSWRVLILPYLDQQALYSQYDFSEPWDGPHNLQLLDRMPSVFACPANEDENTGYTSYLAAEGPGEIFDGDQPVKLSQVLDGLSNTIAVYECSDAPVPWLAPHNRAEAALPSSQHPRKIQALMADGSVQAFSDDDLQDHQRWQAMLTIDGGEQP